VRDAGAGPEGGEHRSALREKLRIVIFEADTPAGKAFDVGLLVAIVLSVAAVMLESVEAVRTAWGPVLRDVEWFFTLLFSVEYALRLYCVPRPLAYARSFFGVVDLLAVLPTYLSLLLPGAQSLLVVRGLRLLRIFRVFKLGRFLGEANLLTTALRGSRHKVIVFLATVLILTTILGTLMYLVEGEESGFTSIPISVYWAIVTLTTVGFGDIVPRTVPGQVLASLVMILGYSIIAIPTGIVTAEIVEAAAQRARGAPTTRVCPSCLSEGHEPAARFCKDCGESLERAG
jgi:voltage-gated potassium channel